jgi:hypothetical protein
MIKTNLPTELHISRTFSYDVEQIIQELMDWDEDRTEESITLEEIIEYISDNIFEDFGSMRDAWFRIEDQDGKFINEIQG